MRSAWEGFADSDPMFFICSERREWDRDEFFATGRRQVEETMEWVGDRIHRGRMLDLGCGLGRITVAGGEHFESVVGADISESMIRQARELNPPANVELTLIEGPKMDELADGSFDLVVCFHVFQHIADEDVISEYLRSIRRLLKPAGRAILHFDTRPRHLLAAAQSLLPDFLLPATKRRFMRRYRRDVDRLHHLIRAARLAVEEERAPRSPLHHVLLAPAD